MVNRERAPGSGTHVRCRGCVVDRRASGGFVVGRGPVVAGKGVRVPAGVVHSSALSGLRRQREAPKVLIL
jgi:hypothetical protein